MLNTVLNYSYPISNYKIDSFYKMAKFIVKNLLVLLILPITSFTPGSLLKKGTALVEKKEYEQALPYFEELAMKSYTPEALRMASICNTKIGDFEKAEQWASKLVTDERSSAEDFELYFNTLVDNARYEKALSVLKEYNVKGLSGTKLDALTNEPDFWKDYQLDTCFHKISRMSLSSYRSELAPSVKGDYLYFGTISTTQSERSGPGHSMNLFYAEIKDDPTTAVRKKTLKETNSSFKDAYINFSKDGKTIFLTKIVKEKKLTQLYYGKSELIKMSELNAFKYNSVEHSVGRATISPDGSKLVFSSNREGSIGQVDLWMCTVDDQGNLSGPINIGEKVNTDKNEVFPYFVSDSRLYFASEGHVGYGRFDLFYTNIENGEFQKPVNMGNPVNTNADDMGICYSEKHDKFFFASDREGNFDIYSYQFKQPANISNDPELVAGQKRGNADQNSYFTVQVMASRNPKDKAVKIFKRYMQGKPHVFALVKEDVWLKFRTGQFKKKEQAVQFATNAGFDNYFVVRMTDDQIIEKIQTN